MKNIIKKCMPVIIFAGISSNAIAASYCDEFYDAKALPKKYARLAPIFSDTDTGWIFASNQLGEDYSISKVNLLLLKEIKAEFAMLETNLAILMPPPRTIAAGQAVFNKTSKSASPYELSAAVKSFSEMTQSVRDLGIVMPDLSSLAKPTETDETAYYFARDTHWTPYGAVTSFRTLAQALGKTNLKDIPKSKGEWYEEKGSLAKIARNTCDAKIDNESVPQFAYPNESTDLLNNDSSKTKIALAGSSFSQRYKRDAYRAAEALAYFMDADVANYSVSGGGSIGALEGMISSGVLNKGAFDTVVWELPYTEGMNNEHALRQLLGALQARNNTKKSVAYLKPDVELLIENESPELLILEGVPLETEKLVVEVKFENRKPKKQKLSRKANVPLDLRSGDWALSMLNLPLSEIISINVK